MIKCIAIDDEPIALTIIDNFCKRASENISIELFSNPSEGIDYLKRNQTDILFLDININGISGLDIAKELPPHTILIFTTAHADYAIHGFDLCATDFLHKPFSFDRFKVAIEKAFNTLSQNSLSDSADKQSITVKVEYKNVTIDLGDITHIEAMDNYIKIHRRDEKTIISQISMKGIMEQLPTSEFIRIHRSHIVARKAIIGYTKSQVTLYNNTTLSVGRANSEQFIKIMSN